MRLTSPLFTFLFFPLSLLFLPFCPQRHRKSVMALLSLAFFLLANFENPLAYLQIGFVVLLICILACIPGDTLPRFRLALGVSLPLSLLACARVLAEVIPTVYTYPFGLGLVCLGGISLSVDRYRGDAPECDKPLSVVGYLLLFPTLLAGPILRYKQYLRLTEQQRPTFATFSQGATLYMIGYVKRLAVASILLFSLQSVLSVTQEGLLPPLVLLLALFLAYFMLYFAVSGTTDMARGLLCIYGIPPTRGQGQLFSATTPHRMLYALLISFDRFLEDYVAMPLKHRLPRAGKYAAAVAVAACTMLFYRTHPAVLLAGAPLLLSALCTARHGRYVRLPRKRLLRVPLCLVSAVFLSVFALSTVLENPLDVFSLLSSFWRETGDLGVYHLLISLSYRHYLMLMIPFLALAMPLYRYAFALSTRLPQKAHTPLRFLSTLLLFVAFLLTIEYLLPQFPQYVELAYRRLLS